MKKTQKMTLVRKSANNNGEPFYKGGDDQNVMKIDEEDSEDDTSPKKCQ